MTGTPSPPSGLSPSSKLTSSTKDLKISDGLDATDDIGALDATGDGLDDVVTGGCSTCGSHQHATVKCEKGAPAEYMMSGALQTDAESSANASATCSSTAAQAAKSAPAKGGPQPRQATGRRSSV